MIAQAAGEYMEAHIAKLEKEFENLPPHQFSKKFERKIAKLTRRADHPLFYKAAYRAASIILAVLLGSGIWLAFDTDARAAFFGWIKNTYEHYFVYNYEGDASDNGITHYEVTWIPEGYEEFDEDNLANMLTKAYVNEDGMVYSLFYTNNANAYLFISCENAIEEKVTVNGIPADLYISSDPAESSTIVWKVGRTILAVDGFLDKDDLIKAAESVIEVEK